MLANVHCANCGAAFGADAKEHCAFCGAERPRVEPEVRHVFAPNAEERWVSAERHPSMEELLAREPIEHEDGPFATSASAPRIAAVAGALTFAAGTAFTLDGRTGPMVALLGLVVFVAAVLRLLRLRALGTAPWQRALVLVLDKRRDDSEGHGGPRLYVATRSRAGGRREWLTSEHLHKHLQSGDLGVAYAKLDRLVDFRKLPV